VTTKAPAEQVVKDIRRATRKLHSSEEKIRIVLCGLRGEDSIAELCRKEGIAQSLYYSWSKEFLEAGKKRLAGDTARQANTGEVKGNPLPKVRGCISGIFSPRCMRRFK
jgi:transposase